MKKNEAYHIMWNDTVNIPEDIEEKRKELYKKINNKELCIKHQNTTKAN